MSKLQPVGYQDSSLSLLIKCVYQSDGDTYKPPWQRSVGEKESLFMSGNLFSPSRFGSESSSSR